MIFGHLKVFLVLLPLLLAITAPVSGEETDSTLLQDGSQQYNAAKVVYDVSTANPKHMTNILDRVSLLQNIYGGNPFDASIIVVIHGEAIPSFTKKHNQRHQELIERARNLEMGEVIQFRLCRASARMQGYKDQDIYNFVELVPMADAEIIKLQHDGYALMH